MKAKNIAYWTTTILAAFSIGIGGVAQVTRVQGMSMALCTSLATLRTL
jgi:hypothetical protein